MLLSLKLIPMGHDASCPYKSLLYVQHCDRWTHGRDASCPYKSLLCVQHCDWRTHGRDASCPYKRPGCQGAPAKQKAQAETGRQAEHQPDQGLANGHANPQPNADEGPGRATQGRLRPLPVGK